MSRYRSASRAAALSHRQDAPRTALLLIVVLFLIAALATPFAAFGQASTTQEAPAGDASAEAPPAPATPTPATHETAKPTPAPAAPIAPMQANVVGWLELSGSLREGPIPFAWVTKAEADPSLSDVLSQLQTVANGQQYQGLVIYLDEPALSLNEVTSIMEAMQQVRKAGKRVLVFADNYDLRSYMLASAADLILLQNHGQLELAGLAIEEMYLVGLLQKIGVQADFVQVGEFKGADEQLTRTGPSEAWSQNIDGLLDDLYGQIVSRIAKNRGLTTQQFEDAMAKSWDMTDIDYLKARLIDRLVSRDMIDVTEVEFGDDFIWDDAMGISSGPRTNIESPFALFSLLFQQRDVVATRPSIAVLYAFGEIHSGLSTRGAGAFGDDSIGSKTMVELLGYIRDDDNVKGLILRLDSPGGSALASEVIWQAVRSVAETKPVYVSVGSLAASGGYYISSAADQIYASPQSILGSIGVVGGKMTFKGLYDWAGVGIYRRERGPMASMFNSVEPFTPEQRDVIRRSMVQVYDQFIDRVNIGRGKRISDIDKIARGRLFTGEQAVQNGMADRIGNLDLAIADLVKQVNLVDGQYDVIEFPSPMSVQEFLSDFMGANAGQVPRLTAPTSADASAIFGTIRKLVGPQAWGQISSELSGMLLLRDEHVLTLMPSVLIVK